MNRKRYLVLILFSVLTLTAFGLVAFKLQKNKESTTDRMERKASETDAQKKDSIVGDEEKKSTENANEVVGDNVLMVGAVKIELLSAEVFEGEEMETETTYPVEYFYNQKLPAAYRREDITDWDAVYEEDPEFKEFRQADYGAYSREETVDIMDAHKDLIEKYTQTIDSPQKAYFIKCRLTNMSPYPVEDTFPHDVVIKSPDTGEITYDESLRYFDKSVYTEGDAKFMKYYFFNLDGNESMECTIGLVVAQKYGENEKYYFGEPVTDGSPYDPATLPDFVDIDSLPIVKQ